MVLQIVYIYQLKNGMYIINKWKKEIVQNIRVSVDKYFVKLTVSVIEQKSQLKIVWSNHCNGSWWLEQIIHHCGGCTCKDTQTLKLVRIPWGLRIFLRIRVCTLFLVWHTLYTNPRLGYAGFFFVAWWLSDR